MRAEEQFGTALSAYASGDLRMAARNCLEALDAAPADAALTVRVIHLYLTATELWWFLNATEDVGGLVARAHAAACSTDDVALKALACYMRGRYLVATNGLAQAVEVLSEAASLAATSGDRLAELQAFSDLGHHMVGQNLEQGLSILHQAQKLAEQIADQEIPARDRPLLLVCRARLKGLLGVAAFDNGQFGEAETALRSSLHDLQVLKAWDQHAIISNYLGQLLTDMGRFEEAEAILLAALEPLWADASLSTFQAYNLGMLGKLYLEWGRTAEAVENLNSGWVRIQRTRHQAILPILRNYLGELYLDPSYSAQDVGHADELFNETITECRRSEFHRSEIAAMALLALARLALGDSDGAAIASAAASDKLDAMGTMPALRSEEVYLIRYEVLNSVSARPEAEKYLAKAKSILLRKAATISDPALRQQFLTRVKTSAKIMDAR